MRMRQGWEEEAANWAAFARTPGYDKAHQHYNGPAFLALLPQPGAGTLDLACGEGRLSRVLAQRGHRVAGIDAAPTMVRFAASHQEAQPVVRGERAGLLIEAIRELRVPDEFVQRDPAQRRWQRIPLFMHIRAVSR